MILELALACLQSKPTPPAKPGTPSKPTAPAKGGAPSKPPKTDPSTKPATSAPAIAPGIPGLVPPTTQLSIVAASVADLDLALGPISGWLGLAAPSPRFVEIVTGLKLARESFGVGAPIGIFGGAGADRVWHWTVIATATKTATKDPLTAGWKQLDFDALRAWTQESALAPHAAHAWGSVVSNAQVTFHADLKALGARDEKCVSDLFATLAERVPMKADQSVSDAALEKARRELASHGIQGQPANSRYPIEDILPFQAAPFRLLEFLEPLCAQSESVEVNVATRPPAYAVDIACALGSTSLWRELSSSEPHGAEHIAGWVNAEAPAWLLVGCDPRKGGSTLTRFMVEWNALLAVSGGGSLGTVRLDPLSHEEALGGSLVCEVGTGRHGGWFSMALIPPDPQHIAQQTEDDFRASYTPPVRGDARIEKLPDGEQKLWHGPPELSASQIPPKPGIDAEEMARDSSKFLRATLGADGQAYSLTQRGPVLIRAIGDDELWHARFAHMPASAHPSPDVDRALHTMEGLNPAFATRIDFSQLSLGASDLRLVMLPRDHVDESVTNQARRAPALDMSGGVDASGVWHTRLQTDLAALLAPWSEKAEKVALESSDEYRRANDGLDKIGNALTAFRDNNHRWPKDLAEMTKPDAQGLTYFTGDVVPLDPWGHAFIYAPPATVKEKAPIVCLGADGKPGGRGLDADLELDVR